MSIATETPTRRSADPVVVPQRRLSDPAPTLTDLGQFEFEVPKGSRSWACGDTGHEHPVDQKRFTVTCEVCSAAQRLAAGVDMQHISFSVPVPADTWLEVRQYASGKGTTAEALAQTLVLDGIDRILQAKGKR